MAYNAGMKHTEKTMSLYCQYCKRFLFTEDNVFVHDANKQHPEDAVLGEGALLFPNGLPPEK
jgi:hypothetical protein